MRTRYVLALISFMMLLGSLAVPAQPPAGQPDEDQRRGERRRPAPSVPVTPDAYKGSSGMVGATEYTLYCRGGYGFVFREVDRRLTSSLQAIVLLEMSFAPGDKPAGSGLQPGECALAERAFSRDDIMQVRDPVKVRFETPANSQLKQTQHGTTLDRSPTAAERYPDAITIPVYLQRSDQHWKFKVTLNHEQGYFLASSHTAYVSPVGGTTPIAGGLSRRRF